MAKRERGSRPTLTIKKDEAKKRVEEMFGGDAAALNAEETPVLEVAAVVPLPEHADPEADTLSAKDIKDRLTAIFDSLGTDDMQGTQFPRSRDNKSAIAAEFAVAQTLKKRAEKRYEKAKAEGDAAGLFGNKDEYVSGETTEVYRSGAYTFSVQKNNDSEVIDKELTEAVLKEVAPGKWQELLKRCKKRRAGATQIIVALR